MATIYSGETYKSLTNKFFPRKYLIEKNNYIIDYKFINKIMDLIHK